ncbi:MAG: hypothetical protein JXA19_05335 [Anaerolineales bacterium]|nr:hypothetical protein [Anaerolineales bacterium]
MKKKFEFVIVLCLLIFGSIPGAVFAQEGLNPTMPSEPVKLIFIHHSVGENWLSNEDGGLGRALGENNYFISDTYYGWGPGGIGDATDIPDWIRWFRSNETQRIMDDVYNESDDDAAGWDYYNRPMSDPGGENTIILFKSCYPNSELAGNPNDPPGTYADYTVAGAKYVYIELLQYFEQHPDKLFIAITAPPVIDDTYADNARAFTTWLVEDWLDNYSGTNVAVWDLYNVLSDPDNHHMYLDGEVVYTNTAGDNTTAYPSGDAHPNSTGNQKATREFVPMLNIYYNRWQSGLPAYVDVDGQISDVIVDSSEEDNSAEDGEDNSSAPVSTIPLGDGKIDDFDHGQPAETDGWNAYSDEASSFACESGDGNQGNGMHLYGEIVPAGWATCELYFYSPRDYSQGNGIQFIIHAEQSGTPYGLLVYSGASDNPLLFGYESTTSETSVSGWDTVVVPWESMRSLWDEAAVIDPALVQGVIFSFGDEDAVSASIWVDDISVVLVESGDNSTVDIDSEDISEEAVNITDDTTSENDRGSTGLSICGNIVIFPLIFLAAAVITGRSKYWLS